jgi:endonuclease YncB( thermonuclease family)
MAPKKRTKAIDVAGIFKTGQFQPGNWGSGQGTVAQVVHDGDTVGLRTPLNFSSRFLGVDTPEISFTIRTKDTFVGLGNPKWKDFFTSGAWKNMPLAPALKAQLSSRIGNGSKVAENHDKLAKLAEKALEQMIKDDLAASGRSEKDFLFFLAFSYEFLDQYARMLCYLHADRANYTPPAAPDKLSYNERMLSKGWAVPYFIFPNLQPFMSGQPFDAAKLTPVGFWKTVNQANKLKAARKAVADARTAGRGVFDPNDRLILLPYELRFIARLNSKGPDRSVIDLGNSGGNTILKPETYFTIANLEDRLFIPREFVPLFLQNGWQMQ